jgi:hypothetical protein
VATVLHCNASRTGNGRGSSNTADGHGTDEDQDGNERKCDAIFMWWQLEMDVDGEIILSTAPRWAHPTPENMQVVFHV